MEKEFNITEWTLKNKLTEEQEEQEYPPYMYSPVGFSCKVCKYVAFNKDEDRWVCSNKNYQEYMGTHYLVDNNGESIKDPSKWCSNWFLPKGK
jgi:hypothetical protein